MPNRHVLEITDSNFDAEVLSSERPFLLELSATWCQPCRVLEPIVERLAEEGAGHLRVGKADIDESPGIAKRFSVRGAPTMIVFKNGKEAARHLGLTDRKTILELLAR